MTRPILYVLAGVNGAGKSSLGGHALRQAGLDWFNPDTFTRQLVETTGSPLADANAAAWREGMRLLDAAIANGNDHAFETTLGGTTIAATLRKALQWVKPHQLIGCTSGPTSRGSRWPCRRALAPACNGCPRP